MTPTERRILAVLDLGGTVWSPYKRKLAWVVLNNQVSSVRRSTLEKMEDKGLLETSCNVANDTGSGTEIILQKTLYKKLECVIVPLLWQFRQQQT